MFIFVHAAFAVHVLFLCESQMQQPVQCLHSLHEALGCTAWSSMDIPMEVSSVADSR